MWRSWSLAIYQIWFSFFISVKCIFILFSLPMPRSWNCLVGMFTTVTGVAAGQMYTYPARCWRKKRRLHNATDPRLGIYGLQLGKIPQPLLHKPPARCFFRSSQFLLPLSCPSPHPSLPPTSTTSFSSCDYWWWSRIIWLKAYHSLSAHWAEQAASHFSEDEMWLCSPRLVNLFCEK